MADLKSGVPTAFTRREGGSAVHVMIGVDPHKGSHTAVAVDDGETELARLKVRASSRQVGQLLEWATPFEKRTWAVESARGLGYLLAQQLVAAGETVLDFPATLAARVRVLGSGRSDKNDPNDAPSVAVAALRAPGIAAVDATENGEVLRLLARRNNDLGRARNRTACRLHIAAVSQIRHAHSEGRAFYERKLEEGKTKKEALRALKRRVSDLVYRQLLIDAEGR